MCNNTTKESKHVSEATNYDDNAAAAVAAAAAAEEHPSSSSSSSTNPKHSVFRFAICAFGICVCYMYYGIIQEKLMSKHHKRMIGPSFVLWIQCVTNVTVARIWWWIDHNWLVHKKRKRGKQLSTTITKTMDAQKKKNDDLVISTSNTNTNNTTELSTPTNRLHHPLLCLTSLCYVSAMVCSNESLHYVSYPTAVLAKSCKMIPTMIMGVLVERKRYAPVEWMAAFCITLGIYLFNASRLKAKIIIITTSTTPASTTTDNDDSSTSSWIGICLLVTSLIMDGFLGACQGLVKKTRTLTAWNPHVPVRSPNAVETMLYINLYALLFLLPFTIWNGQWTEGWTALLPPSYTTTTPAEQEEEEDEQESSSQQYRMALLQGLLLMNVTVATGQIFIFLTITWYSSLICTTITTTRKFFTILLSIVYFKHHFTSMQWVATTLVFAGLYLGIVGQRTKQQQSPSKNDIRNSSIMGDFSTTDSHYSPRRTVEKIAMKED